jgi:hypothetical protein
MSRGSAGAYFADHPRLEHESAALRDGRFWREADVRGAILESAAEGKTIAAKRGSRGALELWPTIEQGTNRPPSTLPLFTTV